MTGERKPDDPRDDASLPPRAKAQTGDSFPSHQPQPGQGTGGQRFAPFERSRRSPGVSGFAVRDRLAFARKPGVFLLAALLCVLLTLLVKSVRNDSGGIPATAVAEAAVEQVDPAPAGPPEPNKAADAARPAAPAAKAAAVQPPHDEPQPDRRTVPLAQLEALVPKKAAPAPAEATPPKPEPIAVPPPVVPPPRMKRRPLPNPVANREHIRKMLAWAREGRPIRDGLTDFDEAEFSRDPQTGIWLSKDHRWHATRRYLLPVDDQAIDGARMQLLRTTPVIELQWWFPRTIEIAEEHFKGKVAKLRFLAVGSDLDSQSFETSVRVLRTLGTNPGGISLVEADALFYLRHTPADVIRRRMGLPRPLGFPETWSLVPMGVTEHPNWFVDGKNSIRRGDVGPLPVTGREIDALRKAVRESEEEGKIREVKFWPARVEPTTRHRLSMLRYEVVTDRGITLEEAVFDHNKGALVYIPLSDDVFPEEDRHATSLDRTAK